MSCCQSVSLVEGLEAFLRVQLRASMAMAVPGRIMEGMTKARGLLPSLTLPVMARRRNRRA